MDSVQKEFKSLFGSMSLNQLSIPDIDFGDVRGRLAEQEKILKKFKDKYGEEDGWTRYLEYRNRDDEYGSVARIINKIIYDGCSCFIRGNTPAVKAKLDFMLESRKREVYGDEYDKYIYHDKGDPHVCDLLIQDAMRTGKWMDLPLVLRDEYHRRVGDD